MNQTPLKETHPISFRPFSVKKDAACLLKWVNNPHAQYWGMLDATAEELITTYTHLLSIPDYKVYIGEIQNEAAFLMESYNPKTDPIGQHYPVLEGDCGMHVLVKPPQHRISGFTWHVFSSIMDFLFEQNHCKRIVVEPDVNNHKIHRLNKRAGFVYDKQVNLPDKKAFLAFCTYEAYQQSRAECIVY
ncbi:GNAT family N-acetyltransferase [Aureispira sp. CCB-QB1]|uniref:GNAT family N-acetyltransferase n=1 Tax=Aureispira sp. CCB-QB1 TaxID=1313421 RepID=UPI000696E9F4|nr:GNAT family N-acetyltransferase [Aureispira sp. CCB-QB1]